jgi:hypothetical protein
MASVIFVVNIETGATIPIHSDGAVVDLKRKIFSANKIPTESQVLIQHGREVAERSIAMDKSDEYDEIVIHVLDKRNAPTV